MIPADTPEPMTPLVEASASMHEWYLAMLVGGFTRSDALEIIATVISKSGQMNS
jgi:hypothetical protein